ncbi:MAG TPA: hypothetical protein VK504_02195 [Vicinamibacterales bacterium]|jgi:hypothetical protein|nr:hypothetical protein [Vicinamibacterales bacterium]
MTDDRTHDRLTLRIPKQLSDELRKAAHEEANSTTAVIRRLITKGLRDQNTKGDPDPHQ